MSILVTGATGHLGRLVVQELLAREVPAAEITAAGRRTDALADLAELGVRVAPLDYDDPASVQRALDGVQRVLLVSSSEVGRRAGQHQTVIDAAAAAGVAQLAYTSIANADRSSMQLAVEHLATERALQASGLPVTVLRNGWYLENYTDQLPAILERRVVAGSAGTGRISGATRADLAAAAAAVLVTDGHLGAVYELGGEPFSLGDLAAAISRHAGVDVGYQHLAVDAFERVLVDAGVPAPFAAVLADSDRGIAEGDLVVDPADLRRLAGRPLTTLDEAIAAALVAVPSA